MLRDRKLALSLFLSAATFCFTSAPPAAAQVQLGAGDLAIIGWVDNGNPQDAIALLALSDLPAGAVIFFTDNGWDGVAGAFRNNNGPTFGAGSETLMKLVVNGTIPAGRVFSTLELADPAFTWVVSGSIPGALSGSFSWPALAQSGDQIYAFQHTSGVNPLNTPAQQHLFVLDDTGDFEDATSSSTGGIPPGLSLASGTALTFLQSASSQNFMAFKTQSLASGTKPEWLAAMKDPANWTFGSAGTLPNGSVVVTPPPITSFCAGDGSLATGCPCGNNGQPGKGCENSAATGGALLLAAGSPVPDTVVLSASGLLPTAPVIFLQGDQTIAGGVAFGDGVRCAGGLLKKLAVKFAAGGMASYPVNGEMPITLRSAALGDPIPSGGVRVYQAWYRDADAFFCVAPLGNTWNASNAIAVTW